MLVIIGQAAAMAVELLRSNDSVSGLDVTHPTHRGREGERQSETERQTDKQTDRQTDRQTVRQSVSGLDVTHPLRAIRGPHVSKPNSRGRQRERQRQRDRDRDYGRSRRGGFREESEKGTGRRQRETEGNREWQCDAHSPK